MSTSSASWTSPPGSSARARIAYRVSPWVLPVLVRVNAGGMRGRPARFAWAQGQPKRFSTVAESTTLSPLYPGGPAIALRNLPVNQDACQGASFPLAFSGEASVEAPALLPLHLGPRRRRRCGGDLRLRLLPLGGSGHRQSRNLETDEADDHRRDGRDRQVDHFTIAAATITPAVSAADNLTITALDAYGNTATAYTGSHNVVLSGAMASPAGNLPTVSDSAGSDIAFGTATPIVFSAGVAGSSGGENGETVLYKSAAARE
jgi:hypothetical protein